MTTNTGDRFPLLDLPASALTNVLQRCPSGSIAGFSLPLALAQIRLTGSVDPHWLRPLLHVAAKSPAVIRRISPHLRSLELMCGTTKDLEVVLPQLTRLESLSANSDIPEATMAVLPTTLTRLERILLFLASTSADAHAASLLRLTALEDLRLRIFPKQTEWAVGGSLPRLRRLQCSGRLPSDFPTFAPNLEALEAWCDPKDLDRLPRTLTRLVPIMDHFWLVASSDLHGGPLAGLRELSLPDGFKLSQLPKLLGGLRHLTLLEMRGPQDKTYKVPELLEGLESGPKDLGVRLGPLSLGMPVRAVKRFIPHLVDPRSLPRDRPDFVPWTAISRITPLSLEVDGIRDPGWIPSLTPGDLDISLIDQVPAWFGDVARCTRLTLSDVESTANLACLQHLTRLKEVKCDMSPIECIRALPGHQLTRLQVSSSESSPDLPLDRALQHLSNLEHLEIDWPEDEDRVCDLSPLKRLTSLVLQLAPCPLVRLGTLPCLRSLRLEICSDMGDAFLQQLVGTPSLRSLSLDLCMHVNGALLTDDGLVSSLAPLSLLEGLVLPRMLFHVTPEGVRRLLDQLPLLDTVEALGITRRSLKLMPEWAELVQSSGGRFSPLPDPDDDDSSSED